MAKKKLAAEEIKSVSDQMLKDYEKQIDGGMTFEKIVWAEKVESNDDACFRETILLLGENGKGVELYQYFRCISK